MLTEAVLLLLTACVVNVLKESELITLWLFGEDGGDMIGRGGIGIVDMTLDEGGRGLSEAKTALGM